MTIEIVCVVALTLLTSFHSAHAQQGCVGLDGATSCTELYRQDCQDASGDCGGCFDGYVSHNQSSLCTAVLCGVPQPQPNASPESMDQLFFGDSVSYICDQGTAVDDNTFQYEVQCSSDGTLTPAIPGQSCQDIDFCASGPCGEHICQEKADGTGYTCSCKSGFAGSADEDGSGCYEPAMEVVEGTVHVVADDVVLNRPQQPAFTSLRTLVQQVEAASLSRRQLSASVQAEIASTNDNIASLRESLTHLQQDTVANISHQLSDGVAAASADIASLSTELSTEVSTARNEEQRNRDEVNTLRQLLIDLASSHEDLGDNHNDTRSFALTLAQEIADERTRAVNAEQELNDDVLSLQTASNQLETANMELSTVVDQLTSRVDDAQGVSDELEDLKAELSQLKLLLIPRSCLDVKKLNPNAESGEYSIRPAQFTRKTTITVYCDMETDGGGWTRTGHLNGDQITEIPHNDANNMLDASALGYRSFSGLWFSTQPTSAMMYHYVGGGGESYGAGHHIRITWNDKPFTYGVYDNHLLEDCRNLDTGTVWSNCWYSSHEDPIWQSCSFSFTSNGVSNNYRGNSEDRIILGPTARPGGNCFWHNFGGDTNSQNVANNWDVAPDKEGYIYFR